MRYKNTKLGRDKNGVRFYKPTIVPNIPIKDSDIFVYPVYGDRFDTLAHRYYNDSNLWWIIAKANGIKGKIGLEPSTLIRIPGDVVGILEKFEDLNQ